MSVFELTVGSLLGVLGLRSLVHWVRRPFPATRASDHVLYALFLTGRVGVWFALAGLFIGYAVVSDDASIRGFVLIPILLAALSAMCSYALGRGD